MTSKINSPKNQSQFSYVTMEQYYCLQYVSKTKPEQKFKSTWNAFKKFLQNLKIVLNRIFYWLTNCLTDAFRQA